MDKIDQSTNSSLRPSDPAKVRRGDPATPPCVRCREARRGERGQSLVELALSLTVIMMLLAGAVDFSMAYFSFTAMQDAAQEGALYGSVNPTDEAGIETRVRSASANPVDLSSTSRVQVEVDVPAGADACEGDEVTVHVRYEYPISMPFIGGFIGSQKIPLHARVTDTILQPPCSP